MIMKMTIGATNHRQERLKIVMMVFPGHGGDVHEDDGDDEDGVEIQGFHRRHDPPPPRQGRPWADFADSSSGGSNNCSALQ